MRVLIIENDSELGAVWSRHLEREGMNVEFAESQADAIKLICLRDIDLIVLNLHFAKDCSFSIADFAAYRRPNARVVFVSASSFFSDGSIFRHASNACAHLPACIRPEDLCAVVEHYGAHP